jgi:hypothetical protein
MAKQDDIPKTDPSEIEALIQRLKQSNLEPRDAQLIERLLRLVLSMASLLQHANRWRMRRYPFSSTCDTAYHLWKQYGKPRIMMYQGKGIYVSTTG